MKEFRRHDDGTDKAFIYPPEKGTLRAKLSTHTLNMCVGSFHLNTAGSHLPPPYSVIKFHSSLYPL